MKAIKDIFASNPQRTPLPPLTESSLPPFGPPKRSYKTSPEKTLKPAIPQPQKPSPLAPRTIPSILQPLGQTRPDQFCWGLFGLVMNNGWPSPLWLSTTAAPLNWPWHRAIHWPVWMAAWPTSWLTQPKRSISWLQYWKSMDRILVMNIGEKVGIHKVIQCQSVLCG